MARSKVWDGTNWVYQNTVVHSGGGSGSSTSIITSWDDLPQNPSIGDRATNINDNASSGTNYLLPQIIITAPIGTQITVTNNITTYTTTAISTTSKVNVNDYGEWTVTMVSGDETTRVKTVNVDTVKQYSSLWSRLPNGYQEVEYIQNEDKASIDTGYQCSSGVKVQLDFMPTTDYPSSGHHALIIFGDIGLSSHDARYRCSWGSDSYHTNVSVVTNIKHIYLIDRGEFYVDGTLIHTSSATFTASQNLAILHPNSEYYARGRIYSVIIWNGEGEKVRELIPCYRISDSVVGMYDIVNSTFITNSGTGNFTKGPNVD